MKQEEKELLLRDLCARLPYGVKVLCLGDFNHGWYNLKMVDIEDNEVYVTTYEPYTNKYAKIEEVKPYLFPLSSMTEEQGKEFDQLLELELKAINDEIDHVQATAFEVDFYNKHHLDWRGLIPKGLAIDATGLNIYKEE